MPAKDRTHNELATQLQAHIAHDKGVDEWRESVTMILATQTEILNALRADFKQHEAAEERYQDKVTAFMQASAIERAVIKEKAGEQDNHIVILTDHHKTAMTMMTSINSKVWLAVGAVAVYGPILSFLAVELYRHLTGH